MGPVILCVTFSCLQTAHGPSASMTVARCSRAARAATTASGPMPIFRERHIAQRATSRIASATDSASVLTGRSVDAVHGCDLGAERAASLSRHEAVPFKLVPLHVGARVCRSDQALAADRAVRSQQIVDNHIATVYSPGAVAVLDLGLRSAEPVNDRASGVSLDSPSTGLSG